MQRRFSKGFSLTEVAIAIFIMVMGVVWVYSAINDMIRVSNNAVSRLEAGFLATEGMEFIKNKRDQNYLDYLNMQSAGGCPSGFKSDFKAQCNWMYGIKGDGPVVYNLDQNSKIFTPEFAALSGECDTANLPALLIGSDDRIRRCLEKLYENNSYNFLFQDSEGVYNLVDSTASGGKKTQYKRMVIVSPSNLFPEDTSFPNKYGAEAMCEGSASVVTGDRLTETSQDRVRLDSIVFWKSGDRVEFIHLVTYLFNWHTFI